MSELNSLVGQAIGPYKIIKLLGQGGMASVFLSLQPGLNRDVALKVLLPEVGSRPGFTERFQREAQAIGNLHHPNILPVYDTGQDRGYSYIAMRYIPNARTLADAMSEPLTAQKIIQLTEQIAGALDHAHQAGIIHRDIKPSNILMDGDWVLLSDFGLAKMIQSTSDLTGTGIGVGTPAYMSPEQAKGDKVDQRTDIYSLGIMLFEMLTGQVPHKAETPIGTVAKRITEPLPPPRKLNPNIPGPVEAVLYKCLAINPNERYASAGEFARALRAAFEQQSAKFTFPGRSGVAPTHTPIDLNQPPPKPAEPPPVSVEPPAKSGKLSPIEVGIITLLGVTALCGVSGIFLSFTSNDAGELNIALAPACMGLAFAALTSALMVWQRNRSRPASAWLAAGIAAWFAGVNLLGWGGFAALEPGDNTILENLSLSIAICFAPGGFLALFGLLVYGYDWRRGRAETAKARLASQPAAASSRSAIIEQKLQHAVDYRKHMEKLIKGKQAAPYADQLASLNADLIRWENRLRQLAIRVQNFESNSLIQRDLVEVPAAISRLESQLPAESNPAVKAEISEALASHKTHQKQLNELVTLIRRTELDFDETLAAIGAIYSQLQMLGAKDIDSARARRFSSDINAQANRLGDLLEAMDEVYQSSIIMSR
ncbi:MAG: Serine/threonine-protein kinase PknD [Anaerolineae bacterium]|nr:Serine/threonine-protein kinase PknD [Anaerolineae bacterium]